MITRGKQNRPFYAILYGQPGVGKTTLAAQIPNAVFLDLERGTDFLDVARLQPEGTLSEALEALWDAKDSFDTLVIDSLTALENRHQQELCDAKGWSSINALDYGKSKSLWKAAFLKIITGLDAFRAEGKNVLIVAHQKMREAKDPLGQDTYDQFSFACDRDIHESLLSHVDGVFFLKMKSMAKDDKVIGNGSRVLLTKDRPQFTAKSRWALPEQIENPGAAFWAQLTN